jgi:hypothetical protein
MTAEHDRQGRISRRSIILSATPIVGACLTYLLPSTQAENFIQVCMSGIFVWIIARGNSKSEALVDAALHLAEELAKLRAPDEPAHDGPLADVISIQNGRSEVS